jgi:hypothetical protein
MSVVAINQADASWQFRSQPFAAVRSPQSWSPSAVSVDPLRKRIFALDGLAGRIAALELRDDGLHTVWTVRQRTIEFLALIGSPQRRVLVGTDVPRSQAIGTNTQDRVEKKVTTAAPCLHEARIARRGAWGLQQSEREKAEYMKRESSMTDYTRLRSTGRTAMGTDITVATVAVRPGGGFWLGLALLAATWGTSVAVAQGLPVCSWPIETTGTGFSNIAYPDINATYWTMPFDASRWQALRITGTYPEGRFMSFMTYDARGGSGGQPGGLRHQVRSPAPKG